MVSSFCCIPRKIHQQSLNTDHAQSPLIGDWPLAIGYPICRTRPADRPRSAALPNLPLFKHSPDAAYLTAADRD